MHRDYRSFSREELLQEEEALKKEYERFRSMNLSLTMTRGIPCREQVDLSEGMLQIIDSGSKCISGKTDIRTLSFSSTKLKAILSVEMAKAAGEDLVLSVKANEDYIPVVEAAASDWLSVETPTRAVYSDNLKVTVAPNETNEFRGGTISLISKEDGSLLEEVEVLQAPDATDVTSLSSFAILPDGTKATLYNLTVIAASDSQAILTDGEDFIYANAKGLYPGVFNLTGAKASDDSGTPYIDVTAVSFNSEDDPIEVNAHEYFSYHGYGFSPIYFTATSGILEKNGDVYSVSYDDELLLTFTDPQEELAADSLIGKFVAVTGWIFYTDSDYIPQILPTALADATPTVESGWEPYYGGPESGDPDYPEIIGNKVSNPTEGSYTP